MTTREEIVDALCKNRCRDCGEELHEDRSVLGVCYACMIEGFNRTVTEQESLIEDRIAVYKDFETLIWPPAKK